MQLETKHSLEEETLKGLQELIEINIDSFKGFRQASESVDDRSVAVMFDEIATRRANQASELQDLVAHNGEEPKESGTLLGQIHRSILDLRSALGGGTTAVLNEAMRGEEYIKAKYESVLSKLAGSAVTDVLNRQYAEIQKSINQIAACRDQKMES